MWFLLKHHSRSDKLWKKNWELSISIHQLFVDYKQTHDFIFRNELFYIMEEFGIPKNLIRLIKATFTGTKCKVLIQGTISDPLVIETG